MRFRFIGLFLLIAFSLSAQESDVKYLNDSVPVRWAFVPDVDGKAISVDDRWWCNFEDQLLDSLVTAAMEANYDIRKAARRVNIARAQVKTVASGYYPEADLYAGWKSRRISGSRKGTPGGLKIEGYWDLGIDMSWQVDLFGKIALKADEKKKIWQATQAEWAGVMLSVAGEMVTHFINLRLVQEKLDILYERSKSQLGIVRSVESRRQTDAGSSLQVSQALTLYYSILAEIPVAENAVRSEINAIAILLGVYPDDIKDALKVKGKVSWPSYRQLIASGIPSDILRRRPDVVEAERVVASYAAALGVAKKEFLPNLSIRGVISTSARSVGNMFSGKSYGVEFAPTVSWNLFDGYRRKYGRVIAEETLQAGIDDYNLTVLNAYQEASNAISSYSASVRHVDLLADAVKHARKAFSASVDSYKAGACDFQNVTDAQKVLMNSQNAFATAKRDALKSLVSIYVALGGGWDASMISE